MKQISQLTYMNLLSTYENDPQFKDFISKLSNQCKKYKDTKHLKLESKQDPTGLLDPTEQMLLFEIKHSY